jgi:hypothetical protein
MARNRTRKLQDSLAVGNNFKRGARCRQICPRLRLASPPQSPRGTFLPYLFHQLLPLSEIAEHLDLVSAKGHEAAGKEVSVTGTICHAATPRDTKPTSGVPLASIHGRVGEEAGQSERRR